MNALIVYESMFGSTRKIAEAMAESLRSSDIAVTVTTAADAAREPAGWDLVIVGAPTHAHSLPRPSSRAEAAAWAIEPQKHLSIEAGADGPGVREWLDGIVLPEPRPRFAAFTTRVDMPRIFTGDASVAIQRRLHKQHVDLEAHEDFLVDSRSALLPGEVQRAKDWVTQLMSVPVA